MNPVDLLARLVSIPSVNPLLADDRSIGSEAALAQFLADHLEARGFAVDWREVVPGRPNVVGRFGPTSPRRTLMLEAHLDTQGIHGMTVPPFGAEVRDGRLYGRGACDTKGPMAAALCALQGPVLESLADAGVQVLFVGAIGEEKGNLGAEQLVELGLGADEAVILEPTELAIVHAHKGVLWHEIEVRGRAGHGSDPDRALSAIRAMGRVMEAVEADVAERRKLGPHPVLGEATVNIGLIRGGTSINIVPDRCVIEVDRRLLPGEDGRAILRRLREQLEAMATAGLLTGSTVREIKCGDPFETTTACPLVRRLTQSCVAEGASGRTEGAAWFSDAGPFARTCRDVAVFGPGSIRQAHTADEYIELASLEQGTRILAGFLNRLAQEASAQKG